MWRPTWPDHLGSQSAPPPPSLDALGAPPARWPTTPRLGAEDYTPEIAKVKFHWKMPLKIHWKFRVKIHGKESDNPLENTTDKWNSVGKCHGKPVGKCHWRSTMISAVLISGVQCFAPICLLLVLLLLLLIFILLLLLLLFLHVYHYCYFYHSLLSLLLLLLLSLEALYEFSRRGKLADVRALLDKGVPPDRHYDYY